MATDAEIRAAGFKYVPQQKYLLNPFKLPTAPEEEPVINQGIVNTNAFTGGGGDGYYDGSPNDLIQDYTTATKNQYFDNQKTPNVDDLYQSRLDKTFVGFPSYRQQDQMGPFTPYNQPMDMDDPAASIENIIASRNVPLELTTAGQIQSNLENVTDKAKGIMSSIGGFGPISFLANRLDRFGTLPTADQNFIKMNMGYTGPTVFGENTTGGSKDPFGVNTRSMFGNYAEFVGNKAKDLTDMLSNTQTEKYGKGTSGITFNPTTGMFNAIDEEDKDAIAAALKATKMNKLNITKLGFYTNKKKERDRIQKETFKKQMEDDKIYGSKGQSAPGDASREGASGRRPGSGGTVDRVESGGVAAGQNVDNLGQAYDSGGREGFGYGLKKGGLVSIL